jgi:uncharacterized protein (DUF58 family)
VIQPTQRAVLLFAASLPIAIVLLAVNEHWWSPGIDAGLFALAVIGLDLILTISRRRLEIDVDVPARLYVGTTGQVTVRVRLPERSRGVVFEALAEQRGAAEPPELVVIDGEGGGMAEGALAIKPQRRGTIDIDAVWLRWRGPFRLIERSCRLPVGQAVDVIPDIRPIHAAALDFFSRDAIDGIKVQDQKGEGSEFDSLRDHAPGLDNRFIDWKRSAKHRKLFSKEFKTERNHQIVLAFDTGHQMIQPIGNLSRLDHAINAGLMLAWISLRGGDYVGSFGFDARVRQYLQPVRGVPYFARLQRAAAQLAYQPEETNFTLGLAELNVRLKRRALVILFTEFVDTTTAELLVESVQRMSNRHVVVFVTLRDPGLAEIIDADPTRFITAAKAVVAHDLLRDRAIVLERLERLGVHCLDVPPPALGARLLNTYLKIKDRGLL